MSAPKPDKSDRHAGVTLGALLLAVIAYLAWPESWPGFRCNVFMMWFVLRAGMALEQLRACYYE